MFKHVDVLHKCPLCLFPSLSSQLPLNFFLLCPLRLSIYSSASTLALHHSIPLCTILFSSPLYILSMFTLVSLASPCGSVPVYICVVLNATCYFQHFIILICLPKSEFIFLNFFLFYAHLSLLPVALNWQHQGRKLKHTDYQRARWKMKAQNVACVSKLGVHKYRCRKVHLIGQSRQSNRLIQIEIKEDEG